MLVGRASRYISPPVANMYEIKESIWAKVATQDIAPQIISKDPFPSSLSREAFLASPEYIAKTSCRAEYFQTTTIREAISATDQSTHKPCSAIMVDVGLE